MAASSSRAAAERRAPETFDDEAPKLPQAQSAKAIRSRAPPVGIATPATVASLSKFGAARTPAGVSKTTSSRPMADLGAERYGLLPIRCYTCGREIASYQQDMELWLAEGGDLGGFYDYYGVPKHLRPQLEEWLAAETDGFVQIVKDTIDLLTAHINGKKTVTSKKIPVSKVPDYFGQFKTTVPYDWEGRGMFEDPRTKPLPFTLLQRTGMWLIGDVETDMVISHFVAFLQKQGYLDAILDQMGAPKDKTTRTDIRYALIHGLGAQGYQHSKGLEGFPVCCRTNLRPPPKIY